MSSIVVWESCQVCRGEGVLERVDENGKKIPYRCGACRGAKMIKRKI